MFNTPILFIIFNRPETTLRVFEKIKQLEPRQLFIAADGARSDHPGETKICAEVRKIALKIDWQCNVKTLFREENLGCGKAVSSAISWFFENIDEGIILEDDCLPDISFFQFCTDMLNHYRENKNVYQINGTCWHRSIFKNYSFTNYPLIWGWATWRDRWQKYDYEMTKLDDYIKSGRIAKVSAKSSVQKHFIKIFLDCKSGIIDTWDCQWALTVFNYNGICISPDCNLISNIGCGANATHTHDPLTKSAFRTLETNVTIKLKKTAYPSSRVNKAIEYAFDYEESTSNAFLRRYYYMKHIIKMFFIKDKLQ